MTDLELAAIALLHAQDDFDGTRHGLQDWRTLRLAWRNLRAAVEAAEKATSE